MASILFLYFIFHANAPPLVRARYGPSAKTVATVHKSYRIIFTTELIDVIVVYNCFTCPLYHYNFQFT